MKTLIFLVVSLLYFPLFGQYNPGKLNSVKIGSSYGSFSGLEFNVGYERHITSRQSIYGSVFKTGYTYGFNFGYKYNVISYKWIEAFAGLDLRSEYFDYRRFGSEKVNFNFSIEPTLELRFNVNKTHFITTGLQFSPILEKFNNFDSDWLRRLNIGVSRRF
jgi:hypothetical protein